MSGTASIPGDVDNRRGGAGGNGIKYFNKSNIYFDTPYSIGAAGANGANALYAASAGFVRIEYL